MAIPAETLNWIAALATGARAVESWIPGSPAWRAAMSEKPTSATPAQLSAFQLTRGNLDAFVESLAPKEQERLRELLKPKIDWRGPALGYLLAALLLYAKRKELARLRNEVSLWLVENNYI